MFLKRLTVMFAGVEYFVSYTAQKPLKRYGRPFGLLIAICYSLISMLSLRYLLIFILRSGIINTTKLNNGLEF